MGVPSPLVSDTEIEVHDGQLVRLRQVMVGIAPLAWTIVPPPGVNGDLHVGPFRSRELALAVASSFFSHGASF